MNPTTNMHTCSTCHHDRLVVPDSKATDDGHSSRHQVYVCKRCGLFTVAGSIGMRGYRVEFVLPTDELLEAAARYGRNVTAGIGGGA